MTCSSIHAHTRGQINEGVACSGSAMRSSSPGRRASQRSVRLRILFSFLLGCVTMATLLSVAWLETGQCSTSSGTLCSGPGHRLRRVFSLLNGIISSSTVDRAVDGPSGSTGSTATDQSPHQSSLSLSASTTATSTTSDAWSHMFSTNSERHVPTSKPISAKSLPTTRPQPRPQPRPLTTLPPTPDKPAQPRRKAVHNILRAASINKSGIPSDLLPDLYFVRHTFPTPSDAPLHYTSMEERTNAPCNRTNLCLEYLSHSERTVYANCSRMCEKKKRKVGMPVTGACRFMDGSGRLPVALASFPGSGNTWVRGLLEKITGICTG